MLDTTPDSITTIAGEIGKRNAWMDALTTPHTDEDRVVGEVCDLMERLSHRRPGCAREALVVAAVAAGVVHDLDGVGDYRHELALRLVANLVDHLEAAAGVTADELGVGCYAEHRHDGPMMTTEDSDAEFLQHVALARGQPLPPLPTGRTGACARYERRCSQ